MKNIRVNISIDDDGGIAVLKTVASPGMNPASVAMCLIVAAMQETKKDDGQSLEDIVKMIKSDQAC